MITIFTRPFEIGLKHCFYRDRSFSPRSNKFVIRTFVAKKNKYAEYDEELLSYLHGRKSTEREDSVTQQILAERKKHQERFQDLKVDSSLVRKFSNAGLGSKKRINLSSSRHHSAHSSSHHNSIGAGGFAVHLASAASDWPVFTHVLPEIAFAGHTNSGKSTLVNTISGLSPRKGPAKVSERAGWTDQICFYQLGKRPPLFILADLPGYGHAVATPAEIKLWNVMTRDYLRNREVLSLCCVLVDSTRGLCNHDISLVKFLTKRGIDWRIVLTKCDLLTPLEVAQSALLVDRDLQAVVKSLNNSSPSKDAPKDVTPAQSPIDAEIDQISTSFSVEVDVSNFSQPSEVQKMSSAHTEMDKTTHLSTETEVPAAFSEDDIEWPAYDYDCEKPPALGFQYTEADPQSPVTGDSISTSADDDDTMASMNSTDESSRQGDDISSSNRADNVDSSAALTLSYVLPVSASTGAGIRQLWDELYRISQQSTHSVSSRPSSNAATGSESDGLSSAMDSSKEVFDGVEAAKNLMDMQKSLFGDRDLLTSRPTPGGTPPGQMYAVREHFKARLLRKNVAERQVSKQKRFQR